jgi:hypothetical protein
MRQTVLGPLVQETAKAVTGAFNTSAVDASGLSLITAQYIWSSGSSPSGSVNIEGSLDGTNWSALGTSVTVTGTSGVGLVAVASKAVKYARVAYSHISGTHTAKVIIFGNGI